jgi:hypothetical protein
VFANQRLGRISEFGEDPNGRRTARGLLAEIWTRVQGERTHPWLGENSDPSLSFNGYAPAAQDFTGMANMGGGTAMRDGAYPTIDTGLIEGPMGDPARRILAQRLARRGPQGGPA